MPSLLPQPEGHSYDPWSARLGDSHDLKTMPADPRLCAQSSERKGQDEKEHRGQKSREHVSEGTRRGRLAAVADSGAL